MNGQSGQEQVTNTQNIPMLAAYNIIPETGWGVVQQTPVSFMEDFLLEHIQKLVARVLPPFILLLLLCIFIARKLAAPFIRLTDVMNQLALGKSVPIPNNQSHWNREADLLTKSVVIAIKAVNENNHQLTHAAMTDPLTGIPNRRKLNETMEEWADQNRLFSLVEIDIDHFKRINDTYGHQMGDEMLKTLAQTIQSVIREKDLCFRYGGEEFIALFPDTSGSEAYSIAEKVRIAVENKMKIEGKSVTISLGISQSPLQSASLEGLFKLADDALYRSKFEGRNRTTISGSSK